MYDRRVCDQLDKFKYLPDRTKVTSLWKGYCEYMESVKATAPADLSLRDKDPSKPRNHSTPSPVYRIEPADA